MRKYDDETLLILKCLTQSWDDLNDVDGKKTIIDTLLKKFDSSPWYEFYFFPLGFMCENWELKDSRDLVQAVNILLSENKIKLKKAFQEADSDTVFKKIVMPKDNNKEIISVDFMEEDASMILFMLKVYLREQAQSSLGFSVFEKLYSNLLIPLYHNRNFQLYFMLLILSSILVITPFAPQIALGVGSAFFAAQLTMMIIQMGIFLIYKALDLSSHPISRITTEPSANFSASKY